MAKVAKAFNSVSRRFAVGDDITREDIGPDESMSYDAWVSGGFISDGAPTFTPAADTPVVAAPSDQPGADADSTPTGRFGGRKG